MAEVYFLLELIQRTNIEECIIEHRGVLNC